MGRLWVPRTMPRTRSRYIVHARRGASARTSAGPTRPAAVQTASTDQAHAVGSKAPLGSGENTAEEPAEIITHTIHREMITHTIHRLNSHDTSSHDCTITRLLCSQVTPRCDTSQPGHTHDCPHTWLLTSHTFLRQLDLIRPIAFTLTLSVMVIGPQWYCSSPLPKNRNRYFFFFR